MREEKGREERKKSEGVEAGGMKERMEKGREGQ